jgi:hypothetical protein
VSNYGAWRVRGRVVACAFVFLAAAGCGSSASPPSPASGAGKSAQVTASERRTTLAFSGTYKVKSVITATTGNYAASVGAVHYYTWQAVPECSGQSCVVSDASSTGSHTTFAYSDGAFHGVGHGSASCRNPSTGQPTGAFAPTILHDTLVPAMTSSPITSLTGVVHLTAAGLCNHDGTTATFRYTLTRTGSTPAHLPIVS